MKSKNANENDDPLLVNDINKVRGILKDINWNFHKKGVFYSNEIRPFNCRKYHWYPATFIPEIPFTLIEVLTLPNAVVYDPFSGIGTTYFQALLLNRYPLATEICKVSVEYMKALFILFDPQIDFDKLIGNVEELVREFNPNNNYISNVPDCVLIDKLIPWYSKDTLNQLSFLFIESQNHYDDAALRAAMNISISAILKASSSQDRGWGCIADNVIPKGDKIKDKQVFELFKKNINTLIKDLRLHLNIINNNYKNIYNKISQNPTIFNTDVRKCIEIRNESVDLVVASPPYPNMTDYVTSQRLSYYFLGIDVNESNSPKNQEIGARIKRFRNDSLTRYFEDMQEANKNISKKLKYGGYLCYILPEFKPNDKNIIRRNIMNKVLLDMSQYDLVKVEEYDRVLPITHRSHNITWTKLDREKIYLFRKENYEL
jgi:DNA modification methylase